MKPNAALALLPVFALSAAAGLWLMWPSQPATTTAPAVKSACEDGETCSAPPAASPPAVPAAGPGSSATVAPAAAAASPVAPPRVPAPPNPAEGARLRKEADRLLAEIRVPEALDAFRAAVEADPSAKNHGDLGELLERLTSLDEAGIHLRQAAELDPSNADRWIALANLYYLKTDPGEAWKAEDRARAAEPGLVLGRSADGLRMRKGDTAAGTK